YRQDGVTVSVAEAVEGDARDHRLGIGHGHERHMIEVAIWSAQHPEAASRSEADVVPSAEDSPLVVVHMACERGVRAIAERAPQPLPRLVFTLPERHVRTHECPPD